jgi:hypothetical protein
MKAHGDHRRPTQRAWAVTAPDDPKWWVGAVDLSAKDQTEIESDSRRPDTLDDVGARYEILPMKQLG